MSQTTQTINIGDSKVELRFFQGSVLDDIIFLNVHEDEQTSIEAIKEIRKTIPVNFAYLHHKGTRNIEFQLGKNKHEFDPNRIYTFKGRKATLKEFGKFSFRANKAVKELDKAINKLISNYKIVVTLHNNTDVNYTINSYAEGGDESENTKRLSIVDTWDPDDFIYTTHPPYFDAYKNLGLNAILQDNATCVNDGSLSVHCGKNNIPYINVEAQKGHLNEQINLIRIVIDILNE
ncbi:MAG: hypothetical protein MK078_04235 [Crocinitomicaceae bacterium]|nr:hypothetical protein [Crocinitomicaceae bacterium]